MVVQGGRVFAAEHLAFGFDAATGQELWRTLPDSTASFGKITADERAVYVGTNSHRVYALNVASGHVLWSTDVAPEWRYRGVVKGITAHGDTLYVAAEQRRAENGYLASGCIMALDRNTGQVLWRYSTGTGEQRHNVEAGPTVEGRLLLASDNFGSGFFAADHFTGQEIWRVEGSRGFFPMNPRWLWRGLLPASNDLRVYAFEPQTGRVLWKTQPEASNRAFAVCRNRIFTNYQFLAMWTGQVARS